MIGRPKKYGEDLVQFNLWLPVGLKQRLLEHIGNGNVSAFVRDAVENALPGGSEESRLEQLASAKQELVAEEDRLKAKVVTRERELKVEAERKGLAEELEAIKLEFKPFFKNQALLAAVTKEFLARYKEFRLEDGGVDEVGLARAQLEFAKKWEGG